MKRRNYPVAYLAMAVLFVTASVLADDVQTLRVINDTDMEVEFRIRSQFPHNVRRPWVTRRLRKDQESKIPLRSPDKFVATIAVANFTFQSQPMPLKEELAKDPRYALHVSALRGADPEQDPGNAGPDIQFTLALPEGEATRGSENLEAQQPSFVFSQIVQPNGAVHIYKPGSRSNAPPPNEPRRLGIGFKMCTRGIHIQTVYRDTPANNCRDLNGTEITLENGDHIISINTVPPYSADHFRELIQESSRTLQLTIIDHRTNKPMSLETELW